MQKNPSHTLFVLDDGTHEEVLTRMIDLIKASYVFPDVADRVEQVFLEKLSNR